MEKEYNIIYQITNLINDKYYIGVHSTNKLEDGYMGSGKKLREDIKLYGIENFSRDILHNFETRCDALKKEAELVNCDFLKNEKVYNLIKGGTGVIYSRSKKMRPTQIKKVLFERYDESRIYNVTYHYHGKKEEIFEKTESKPINMLIDAFTDEWYKRGHGLCYSITKMVNNKYTHKDGMKFLNQLLRFPVIAKEIKISTDYWGQMKMFEA